MKDQQRHHRTKEECVNLLEELAQLKHQLHAAEAQLKALHPQSIAESGYSHSLDNYDLGDVANTLAVEQPQTQVTAGSERTNLSHSILRLVYGLGDTAVDSGSLLVCVFTPQSADDNQSKSKSMTSLEMQMIDSIINSCTRAGDLTAFVSHYERAIFLPQDPEGSVAAMISEKIIKAVKNYHLPQDMQGLNYKCSIGIALYPTNTTDIDTLFRYADRASYSALQIDDSYYTYYL